MPMVPGSGESEQDFMHRCVSEMIDSGHAQDQAVAACINIWEGKDAKPVQKAYSLLTIKSLELEQRTIEGIASTPEADSYNDIVELDGIDYKLPLPLLYQHNARQPIGWVNELTKQDGKLMMKAKIAAENPVIPHIAEAWALIKSGLIRGLSIGFRSIEDEFIKGTNGIRFIKSKLVEISAVTIPANESASILAVKSADSRRGTTVNLPDPSGNNKIPVGGKIMATKVSIADQIKGYEAKHQVNDERMTALMQKSVDEGRTFEDTEAEEYDGLKVENEKLVKHIGVLREREQTMLKSVVSVVPQTPASIGTGIPVSLGPLKVQEMAPKGTAFARYVLAFCACNGNRYEAAQLAEKRWPEMPQIAEVLKANIEPATTSNATWAAPLVPNAQTLFGEFLDLLRPATIIGRVPGLRRVPFNVRVPAQTAGATIQWVGEKQAKPVSAGAFASVTLPWAKVAGIVVLTKELVKFSNPDAEQVMRNSLVKDVAQYLDTQFVDPTVGINAGISPASITNGATATPASGVTAAAFRTDMKTAMSGLITVNQDPRQYVILMSATVALGLSLLINPLGQPEFPNIGLDGGTILGLPVVISQAVGARVIILQADEILIAQDPGVTIDMSEEASLVMTDTPEASPAATSLVSLFQRNYIALRVEQFITWLRARTSSVVYISNANYG